MSFRLFIYYCALVGGWAALLGWVLGRAWAPEGAIGGAGIKGMFLGVLVAFGLGLVDALWDLSPAQLGQGLMRILAGVLVGCVGGLIGGVFGQLLLNLTHWTPFVVFG